LIPPYGDIGRSPEQQATRKAAGPFPDSLGPLRPPRRRDSAMPALAVLLPILLPFALLGMVLALGRYEDAVFLPLMKQGEALETERAAATGPEPEAEQEQDSTEDLDPATAEVAFSSMD
jgi:hypothetical protein